MHAWNEPMSMMRCYENVQSKLSFQERIKGTNLIAGEAFSKALASMVHPDVKSPG